MLEFLAHLQDVNADSSSLELVLAVFEFKDMFSSDLSGMSPDRDIDFYIDLG